MIAIRKNSHALQHGGFQILYAEGDLIVFQRQSLQEQMIIAVYRGVDDLPTVSINMQKANIIDGASLTDLITGTTLIVDGGELMLEGLAQGQAMVLRVDV